MIGLLDSAAIADSCHTTRQRGLAGKIFPRQLPVIICLATLIVAILAPAAPSQSVPQPLPSVPPSRLAHISHGVNASEWFAQVYDSRGYTKEHSQNWTTAADISSIRSLGFDHIRLSVNPQPMMDAGRSPNGTAEYFAYLDAAVKMVLDAGLAVELDMHPESDFKGKLARDDEFVERFSDLWSMVAQHYSSLSPDRVFFEILNEPEFKDAYRWYGVETKLAAAIRRAAPAHTIIAAGARWDDDDDLVFLEPLPDPNVIYVFHFYEPHIFTHQGATWGAYYWHWLQGLHYPTSPENAAQIASAVPEARDRFNVIRYGQDHWDAARIEAEINQVVDWATRHKVPIICNEFGVYRKFADPHDRARWINDVRTTLERHHIGWTMWDYSGSFGVVTKQGGRAVPDETTVKALGLHTSNAPN